jgi:hypothetical protein
MHFIGFKILTAKGVSKPLFGLKIRIFNLFKGKNYIHMYIYVYYIEENTAKFGLGKVFEGV